MLNDFERNAAYRAAIRESAAGRVVYDLGAGVGPMSFYALAAGARRVVGLSGVPRGGGRHERRPAGGYARRQ